MPNPWTGKRPILTAGRKSGIALRKPLIIKKAIIAAGAGTGISAKFIEKRRSGLDHYLQFGPFS